MDLATHFRNSIKNKANETPSFFINENSIVSVFLSDKAHYKYNDLVLIYNL